MISLLLVTVVGTATTGARVDGSESKLVGCYQGITVVEWLPAPDMLVPQFGRDFHEARFRNQKWKFTLKSHGDLVMQAPLPSTTIDRGNYIGSQIFKGTWMKNGNTVKFSFKTYTKYRDKEFIEHAAFVGVIQGPRIVLDFYEAVFPANSPREQVPRRYNLWLKLDLVQQFPKL